MFNRLKELRAEKGLSLQQVVDYMGVNKSTVKRWEDGEIKALSLEKLVMLANLFNASPEYILGLSEEKGTVRPHTISAAAEDLTPEEVEQVIDFISYLKNRRRK